MKQLSSEVLCVHMHASPLVLLLKTNIQQLLQDEEQRIQNDKNLSISSSTK